MKRNDTLWNTVRAIAEHELEWFKWLEDRRFVPTGCELRTLPFHPAYGLSDRTRLMALRDAAALGVTHAAETHKVTGSAIYAWRKALLDAVAVTTSKEK